ncbi:MAG: class II aldolase/adducin family protein [Proteobacteria bacterium]|nr:class II aldolase/adducin family protein [Pseudomonadota bacterium]
MGINDNAALTEAELRRDLAAAYRLVALFGWDDLVFTHITAKVPGSDHHFLINPYGMMFEEITASSLVKIDAQGNKVEDSPWPVNPAGFLIHSTIHHAREDAGCVMHTHSLNGVAVSAQKEGLLPLSQQSLFVLSSLAYHDYEGVALEEGERARLEADLGTANYFMLRNHGLLTIGPRVSDAFLAMYLFEAACLIQVRALSGGREATRIGPDILAGAQRMQQQVTHQQGSALVWPGLLRRLDRINPGYAD